MCRWWQDQSGNNGAGILFMACEVCCDFGYAHFHHVYLHVEYSQNSSILFTYMTYTVSFHIHKFAPYYNNAPVAIVHFS